LDFTAQARHGLESYYLVLAQALECDFWIADKRLFNAFQETCLGWVN
jgi:predicted nucleic acid-binding protein